MRDLLLGILNRQQEIIFSGISIGVMTVGCDTRLPWQSCITPLISY
jgi:hypothetical protein